MMAEGEEELEELLDAASGELAVGNLEAAVAGYRRVVDREPASFDGWHALGLALMKSGHLKEAIGAALQATTLKPNDQLAWTALSQMYVQDGQIAEAESAKQKAAILGIGGKIVRDQP